MFPICDPLQMCQSPPADHMPFPLKMKVQDHTISKKGAVHFVNCVKSLLALVETTLFVILSVSSLSCLSIDELQYWKIWALFYALLLKLQYLPFSQAGV